MTENTVVKIVEIVAGLLKDKGHTQIDISHTQSLYEDGLGLDSMDAAALSVALEQEFGSDPFMSGDFPKTIADIAGYYVSKGK